MSDSNIDAYKQIGEEGGAEALAMVTNYMERSAASNDRLLTSLYEGERAAHEQTKERLAHAEAQLAVIEQRIMSLLFDPPRDYERGMS